MNPLISIIIPCYNAAPYVSDAIESAMRQTYAEREVIVIDDGSTDDSLSMIRSFGEAIRWESGPNRGGSAARNRGLELARGEFIQFLDADDLLLPEKLEQQMRWRSATGFDIVTCDRFRVTERDPDGRFVDCSPAGRHALQWIVECEQLGTSSPLHTARSIRAVGGFDETLPCAQEYDLHLRLILECRGAGHLRKPLWIQRTLEGGVSSDVAKVTQQQVRIFERALELAEQKLEGSELNEARDVLAVACIRNARRCLQHSEDVWAQEFIQLAAQFHPDRGLGFYRYNRMARLIATAFGPKVAERIVALRRGRNGYYRQIAR